MLKKPILFGLLIFFIFLKGVYAQEFVFDNANLLENPEKINEKLIELKESYNIVVVIETDSIKTIDDKDFYEAKFHNYNLDSEGNSGYNLLLYYNAETGKGKIIHHKNSKITEEIIAKEFFTSTTDYALRTKDYDELFLLMVGSLKRIFPPTLRDCDKDTAKNIYYRINDFLTEESLEEAISLSIEFSKYCKKNIASYRSLVVSLNINSYFFYQSSDFESAFNLASLAYKISDDEIKETNRAKALFWATKSKFALGDCGFVDSLSLKFLTEFPDSELLLDIETMNNKCNEIVKTQGECELVSGSGNSENIDILFLADDYRSLATFGDDVSLAIEGIRSFDILLKNIDKFNFYKLNKLEYPIDICHIRPEEQNFFERFSSTCKDIFITSLSKFYCPADKIIILSKHDFRPYALDFQLGGLVFLSRYGDNDNFKALVVHELGHSVFGLADEYVEEGKGSFPKYPNCAPDIQTAEEWWGDLASTYEEVGYYEGCRFVESNIRPTKNSIMRQDVEVVETEMGTEIVYDLDFGPVSERHMQNIFDKYGEKDK